MSTPMTDANVEIMNELKKFIDSIAMERDKRASYCYSPTSFVRGRILTLQCTVMLIINGLNDLF